MPPRWLVIAVAAWLIVAVAMLIAAKLSLH